MQYRLYVNERSNREMPKRYVNFFGREGNLIKKNQANRSQ